MKLTYFGHSAFQIETAGTTLLFDPFITGNRLAEPVVRPEDLHPDVIFLTHAHRDHWGDTVDIARRSGALVIANYEIAEALSEKHGHDRAKPMNTGGAADFPWGRVVMTYARHSSSFPDGSYGGNPNGFLLRLEDRWIYNTGDTCAFSEMAWVGEDYAVDLALMPIGDCFTMGPAEAVRAARMIRPRLTLPLHYNTFPPIELDPEAWMRQMQAAGMQARVLAPGETFVQD